MPKNTYFLGSGRKSVVEVSWLGLVYDGGEMTVKFNGWRVGSIPNAESLAAGWEIQLPNGSALQVKLDDAAGLQVRHNGSLLCAKEQTLQVEPDSPSAISENAHETAQEQSDKRKFATMNLTYRTAYTILFVVGGFNVILGLLAYLVNIGFLRIFGVGYLNIVFGLIYGVLGGFIIKKSYFATIAAVAVYGVETLLAIINSLFIFSAAGGGTLMLRVLILYVLIRCIEAVRYLNKKEEPGKAQVAG